MALLGALLSAPALAAEDPAPAPAKIIQGRCGYFAIFTALHYDDQPLDQAGLAELRFTPVQFWEGPYAGAGEARLRTRQIAERGAWGTGLVSGYIYGMDYSREFFPAARIVKTEYKAGCVQ